MEIVIVGAGIGGLVAALALNAARHRPVLYESVFELRELGVGINLLPHAVRVLADLGLQKRLTDNGIETAELLYFNKHGQKIWREARGLEAGYGWPQISIHRGKLHTLLRECVIERIGPDAIHAGHHLSALEQNGTATELLFTDRLTGERVLRRSAELVLGADGIHSAVRAHLHPQEGPPIWNGAVLWRGVCESETFLTGRSMFMAGHANQKFVCYPLSPRHLAAGRSLTNWVAELRFDPGVAFNREDWNRKADPADFLPAFESWNFDWLDIPSLIHATDDIWEYTMVDRDPVGRWSFGNVSLLGDAAHPMYPIGSNGASQAILDAAALAEALDSHDDGPTALLAYQDRRLEPTAGIVRANRGQGPEQVMQMVEDRAPDGFDDLDTVISREELEETALRYKRLAGFDPETLRRTNHA
ncbi:MAG: flavin-dependent oxidoreductase [Rhodospirillaceae bacterium]|nr:flavin-dependent oxidoreductase [Rhodospirillaceae bacterium]